MQLFALMALKPEMRQGYFANSSTPLREYQALRRSHEEVLTLQQLSLPYLVLFKWELGSSFVNTNFISIKLICILSPQV